MPTGVYKHSEEHKKKMSKIARSIGLGTRIKRPKMSEERRKERKIEKREYSRIYMRDYLKKNPEKKKAHKRAMYSWHQKNPDYHRKWNELNKDKVADKRLKDRYGISLEVRNKLKEQQSYLCALCGKHEREMTKGLCLDHNHNTGEIRALLCTQCNALIGYAKESVEILQRAIDYINKHTK